MVKVQAINRGDSWAVISGEGQDAVVHKTFLKNDGQSAEYYADGFNAALLGATNAALNRAKIDKTYARLERNRLVAALSKLFPSIRTKTDIDGWDPKWHNVVYIVLPTGQVSWHYHDDHEPMFEHVMYRDPQLESMWDGHDTEEKYKRLSALRPLSQPPEGFRSLWFFFLADYARYIEGEAGLPWPTFKHKLASFIGQVNKLIKMPGTL